MSSEDQVGVSSHHGCRITHGEGANVKKPFQDIDLTMHELSPSNAKGFRGPLGIIEFTEEYRLPRHIHMCSDKQKLVDERILILNGVALVELAGQIYAVAPGSLVETVGGVPHTFTACPKGVRLPDGTVSTGTFTMVYEDEEPTSFFPTASIEVVKEASDYQPWEGPLEEIRFPKLTVQEVVERGQVVFNRDVRAVVAA